MYPTVFQWPDPGLATRSPCQRPKGFVTRHGGLHVFPVVFPYSRVFDLMPNRAICHVTHIFGTTSRPGVAYGHSSVIPVNELLETRPYLHVLQKHGSLRLHLTEWRSLMALRAILNGLRPLETSSLTRCFWPFPAGHTGILNIYGYLQELQELTRTARVPALGAGINQGEKPRGPGGTSCWPFGPTGPPFYPRCF